MQSSSSPSQPSLRSRKSQLSKLFISPYTQTSGLCNFPVPPPTPTPENANKKFIFNVSASTMQRQQQESLNPSDTSSCKDAAPVPLRLNPDWCQQYLAGSPPIEKNLIVRLLSNHAAVPARQTEGSIGYDLTAAETKTVPAQGRAIFDIGISVRVPAGTYGRIAGRSGLSAFHGITVGGGVIDPDYCGRITVILFNHGIRDYHVRIGERIAQLVLEKAEIAPVKVENYTIARGKKREALDNQRQLSASASSVAETAKVDEEEKMKNLADAIVQQEACKQRGDSGFGSTGM